jgi:tetratricopeptide (TPR) repeat protein
MTKMQLWKRRFAFLWLSSAKILIYVCLSTMVFCLDTPLLADEYDKCVALIQEGAAAYESANYHKAIDEYSQAHDCILAFNGGEETADTAVLLNKIGTANYSIGDYDRAIEYFEKALKIGISVYGEQNADVAVRYNNIGMVYKSRGDYDRAIEFYDKALKIVLAVYGEHHPDVASYYNNLGTVHKARGDYDRAIEFYDKALKIDLTVNGEQYAGVAIRYNNIGMVYKARGDYDRAIEFYKKAVNIGLAVYGGHHPDVAYYYNNIAGVYKDRGDYSRALEFYEKALKIDLAVYGEQHPDVAVRYNNIGTVYKDHGDYDRAIEFYDKALKIMLVVYGEQHPTTAISYNNIGQVYENRGDYDRAIEFYEKALNIDLAVYGEQHVSTATNYTNIGSVHDSRGDYDRAIEFYEKALNIDLAVFGEHHPYVASDYNNIGGVYDSRGDYDRAIEFHEKALRALCNGAETPDAADCRPDADTLYAFRRIAQAYDSTGNPAAAAAAYEKAAAALERLRGNIESQEAKTFHSSEYYELFPEGLGAFAALYQDAGDKTVLERAFSFAEKGIGRVFLEMIGRSRAIVDGGLPPDVVNEGLNLKARLQVARDRINSEETKPKDEQRQDLRKLAYDDFNHAETDLEAYETRLLKEYPNYAELMNPQVRSLDEIRSKVLSPGEAALEYVVGEKASWLIFIKKDGISIHQLPPREEITDKVNRLRYFIMPEDCSYLASKKKQCESTAKDSGAECREIRSQAVSCASGRDKCTTMGKVCLEQLRASFDGQRKALAAELHSMLLGPVESELEGVGRLLIVPTGDLYFLPFEVLIEDGEYLIEKYDIRYTPSLNVAYLVAMRAAQDSAMGEWMGFGDPLYDKKCDDRVPRGMEMDEDTANALANYTRALEADIDLRGAWCRIPDTGKEILAIAGLMGFDRSSGHVFLDQDATEKLFKLHVPKGTRFLHVASHGTLGEGGARQPALVLSLYGNEGSKEDGFLTMTEVFNMKTPAEMVVLSACKTGQGQMEKGEGVAGMSRAFLYAGAGSLVVSLWSVADEETKDLMVRFYEKILTGQDRQEALTFTKREMIKQGFAPYYWAPFIYIGTNN